MLEMVNHIAIEGLIHEKMDISNNLAIPAKCS